MFQLEDAVAAGGVDMIDGPSGECEDYSCPLGLDIPGEVPLLLSQRAR